MSKTRIILQYNSSQILMDLGASSVITMCSFDWASPPAFNWICTAVLPIRKWLDSDASSLLTTCSSDWASPPAFNWICAAVLPIRKWLNWDSNPTRTWTRIILQHKSSQVLMIEFWRAIRIWLDICPPKFNGFVLQNNSCRSTMALSQRLFLRSQPNGDND